MFFVETLEEQVVNQRLRDFYGNHVAVDKPRFRVAFSDDQYEKRYVEERMSEHGIIVPVKAIETCPKYAWLHGQWMVERLIPNFYKDVMEGEYVYECMWAFPENLPLNWEAVWKFVSDFHNVTRPNIPRSQKECDYIEAQQLEKEKKITRDMIDTTPLETSLNDGSAEYFSGKINYKPSEQDNKILGKG